MGSLGQATYCAAAFNCCAVSLAAGMRIVKGLPVMRALGTALQLCSGIVMADGHWREVSSGCMRGWRACALLLRKRAVKRAHDWRRSVARNEKRLQALRACVRMITAHAGGCTTPFPFEAAIWLLEELEELYGGAVPVCGQVRVCALDRPAVAPLPFERLASSCDKRGCVPVQPLGRAGVSDHAGEASARHM